MKLACSTLSTENGAALACEPLTEEPKVTLMVTLVLPGAATTGVLLLPEHVTVVLLDGAVLLHCARAGEAAARSSPSAAAHAHGRTSRMRRGEGRWADMTGQGTTMSCASHFRVTGSVTAATGAIRPGGGSGGYTP
jgi:hypothetical protein